jgi:AbrB family looped-hinge helix DNA binding protein
MYLYGTDFYIDNPSEKNSRNACLGKIILSKKGRFTIPKLARQILNLKPNDNVTCFLLDDKVTFRKVCFIPENR